MVSPHVPEQLLSTVAYHTYQGVRATAYILSVAHMLQLLRLSRLSSAYTLDDPLLYHPTHPAMLCQWNSFPSSSHNTECPSHHPDLFHLKESSDVLLKVPEILAIPPDQQPFGLRVRVSKCHNSLFVFSNLPDLQWLYKIANKIELLRRVFHNTDTFLEQVL